jgi:hypothetical protein
MTVAKGAPWTLQEQRAQWRNVMSGPDDDRDHPLNCNWRPMVPNFFEALGLPSTESRAGAVQAQILTEAFVVGRVDPGAWISYSRRREFYAAHRGRYWPWTYTYDMIVPAIDHLTAAELLDHEKMSPGTRGCQSRIKASTRLLEQLNEHPLAVVHDPYECIILRDADGQLLEYTDTERTDRWRHAVQAINESILSAAIELGGRTIRDGDPLEIDGVRIGAASNHLRRVFNRGSFSLGGRFYGGWWQNIPSERRADIMINGLTTLEMDYPRLHPTLLYMDAGIQLEGDPYDLVSWPRDLVKVGFNTLINADTRIAAVRSVANELRGEGAFTKAGRLVSDIEAKHRPIAAAFGSGAGLKLMRRDSDMTERLMLRLTKRGIPALPVHDSYIVPNRISDKGELMEGMAEALHKSTGGRLDKSTGYRKSIPQYGARVVSPMDASVPSFDRPGGCIVVFFPELQQRDLFGSNSLAVPVSDILGWRGGTAPSGVQMAVRHEARRRGLRHTDVAHRIGISRPQFENILLGRFGASQGVASRIREFLIEGAKTVGGAA